MNKGKYIVIEGAQGVGKTTIVHLIAEQLRGAKLPVKILREPDARNDLTAHAIRQLTQDPRYPINTRAETLLYNAARSQSLQVIRQLTDAGTTCLVDRSYLTTLAIQYYGRGDIQDYQKINDIIDFAVGDIQPDLMVVLDAPVPTLRERAAQRHQGERFDDLDESFLERVRAGYLWEAKQRNLPVVYADEPIQGVFKNVWQYVATTLAVRDSRTTSGPQSVAEVLAASPVSKVSSVEPPLHGVVVNGNADTDQPTAANEAPEGNPAEPTVAESTTEPTPPTTEAEPTPEPWLITSPNTPAQITHAGREELTKYVTSTDSPVYGFTDGLSSVAKAAAMARLGRRGDPLRTALLDEFIGKPDENQQHIISTYGSDGARQFIGQHFVVENASALLAKKLEWGRLATYQEQPSRHTRLNPKDTADKHRYHIPPELKGKLRGQYRRTFDEIFDLYAQITQSLTTHIRRTSSMPKAQQDRAWRSVTKRQACDIAYDVLPLATQATVGIFADVPALKSLILHLLSDGQPEARTTGEMLLAEARKTLPTLLDDIDQPDHGGATISYRQSTAERVKKLAQTLLPPTHGNPSTPVRLTSYMPHNELDVVADMLYEYTDLPLDELQLEVSRWPYQQKLDVFIAYMGERRNHQHRPGRALEKIHYSFELVAKYGSFANLQRYRMVDDLAWQDFSPRLGYEVPKIIEEAGLSDQFERCFDLSLGLYSALQASKYPLLAPYAVLHGHNVRWKVTMNAREALHVLELRTAPHLSPADRKLAQQMHEKIAEVHPQIAEAMIFMNKIEDPELARLAAKQQAQQKQSQSKGAAQKPDTASSPSSSITEPSNTAQPAPQPKPSKNQSSSSKQKSNT
jgi:dTMP kinase